MTITPAPLAKLAEVSQPPRPEVEVDDFDLALLRALAADARQSQRALARQIEMSPPAVADRLARLERSGVIRRYRVRDHTRLRQLLLAKIFQITGVQRTETFLSIADIDPDNFTATLLEDMIQRRADAAGRPRPDAPGALVEIGGVLSAFIVCVACATAASRTLFAMGREGVLPKALGHTSSLLA